jgi:uncharacterized membrane-anchored protein YjiN (DUF445 family)
MIASDRRQDPRRRLRRMRALATGLLAALGVVFVAATYLEARWPVAAYVRAFAEAALVGGCADWFAVEALFRRPLGLPIPHTAVIPRSKDRIGGALGRFLVDNFLSPRLLDARLRRWELGAWGGAWLSRPENAGRLADRILKAVKVLAPLLPSEAMEAAIASVVLAAARATPAAPAASALLAAVWTPERAEPLIAQGLALAQAYLADHQAIILEKVQAQSWRWLPSFVDRAVARKIADGLAQLLSDLQQPDHPWRTGLNDAVAQLIERLAHDPEMRARGERLKDRVLADPRLGEQIGALRAHLRAQVAAGLAEVDGEAMRGRLTAVILAVGGWINSDPDLQRTLSTTARAIARRSIGPQREALARYVAQTVEGWDARGIVERLEHQVGPDLQYIRLNGTIVGGVIGLLLFSVGRLLH